MLAINQSMVAPIAINPKTIIAPRGVLTDEAPPELEAPPVEELLFPLTEPDVLLGYGKVLFVLVSR
jgi:hypothetical protein